ncbi:hypothetical protein [Microcoleus vaginatus]|uniref:hypothetical protein n=1 Tax=Microcoleus vaginatus TaxID=119532 RepID=UPI004040A9D9
MFWRSNADPERLKMLQTNASERQARKIEINAGKSERTAEDTESTEDGKEEGGEVMSLREEE